MQRVKKKNQIRLTDHGCIISLGLIQEITMQNNELYSQIVFMSATTKYVAVDTLRKSNFYKLCTLESVTRLF